ncbi:MAG: ABC transporter ATP-binding protein [Aquabacterium sp.]
MIELRHVTKRYGAALAIDDLSLLVRRGECVVLLGPSGSGKSTALRLINRLVDADAGQVLFDGRDVREQPAAALRRQMGYVIQSTGLFPHWTVARNIATVPQLLGWPKARIAARVDELLALLGLDPGLAPRYPHQLSGGQQQRVGVARALAAQPQVLLMDEPFGALDPLTRHGLQGELLRIHRMQGQTIVLVTHDIDEALRLATRIVLLDRGRLVQAATPAELLRRPANAWVADFLGRDQAALRLLALRCVGDAVRPGAVPEAGGVAATAGPALLQTQSLREALAAFLAHGVDRLPVADAQGTIVGMLHLADLMQPVP